MNACNTKECSDRRDCPNAMDCVDSVCTAPTYGGNLRQDASLWDTGTSTRTDGAAADAGPDGGVDDDGGPLDGTLDAYVVDGSADGGSDAADIGATDGPGVVVLPNEGLVWVADPGAVMNFAVGRLFDRSNVGMVATSQDFDLGTEGSCVLRAERVVGGTMGGFDLARIEIQTSITGVAPITLTQVAVGLYEPFDTPTTLFYRTSETEYHLFPPEVVAPNPLDETIATTTNPPSLTIALPVVGSLINIPAQVQITWTPTVDNHPLVVELATASRSVLLTCVTPGDGSFLLPLNATQAWRDIVPTDDGDPYLDVRYQEESTRSVGPVALPVTFRASRGERYQVVLN